MEKAILKTLTRKHMRNSFAIKSIGFDNFFKETILDITCEWLLLLIIDLKAASDSSRSSRSQVFFKIDVLKKFVNIHRKTPVLESPLIKLQVFRPATLLKKRLQHSCFPVNIVNFLRTGFLQNTAERQVLELNLFLSVITGSFHTKT